MADIATKDEFLSRLAVGENVPTPQIPTPPPDTSVGATVPRPDVPAPTPEAPMTAREAFLAKLNAPPVPVEDEPPTTTTTTPQATPQTTPPEQRETFGDSMLRPIGSAASAAMTMLHRPFLDTESPDTRRMLGERPGVPFDITGTDRRAENFTTRMVEQFTLNRAELDYFIKRANPNIKEIRYNSIGDPVLTITDPNTGEERDVLANPVGMDPGDFAFVLANAPSMLAGAVATLGRNPTALKNASSIAKWFLNSRSGVIAANARGALASGVVNTAEQLIGRTGLRATGNLQDVNAPTVLKEQGYNTLSDFLFGTAVDAPMGKLASRFVTPLSQRGPIQMDAEAAAEMWRREGVIYDFTPAQATGSPFLGRTEAYGTIKPGSAGVFAERAAEQRAAVDNMIRITLGRDPSAVPPADIVGQRAMSHIGTQFDALDHVVDRGTRDVLEQADQEIKNGVAAATRIPSNVSTTSVGQRLFQATERMWNEFNDRAVALARVVTDDPRISGQGRNIDTTPLARDAQEALASMASIEREVGVPGYDPTYGNPIEVFQTQTRPIAGVLNPNTTAILNNLSVPGRTGYADLIEARADIGRAMDGFTLGGIPEARLGKLYASLTLQIERGLETLDDTGALRQAWQTAQDFKRNGMQRFKNLDILPILKEQNQAGALNFYEIVDRASRDQGVWSTYRDFFGAQSPEMDHLRRSYADSLIGRTLGNNAINMDRFAKRLTNAFEKQPDIVDDVFGQQTEQLLAIAQAGGAAQKGKLLRNVDAVELAARIDQGSLTKESLEDLATLQEAREIRLRNTHLDQLRKGEFRDEPSKLVENLIFSPTSEVRDVREVMSLLSDRPDIIDEMRQRTILRIFHESMGGPEGKERLHSAALRGFLQDDPSGDMLSSRIHALVGDETMRRLRGIHDITRPADIVEGAFKAAGGISAGMQIATIEKELLSPTGMVGQMGGILKSFLLAELYKFGPTHKWITNNAFGLTGNIADRAAFVNAFIAGAPIMRDLATFFATETEFGTAAQIGAAKATDAARMATIQIKGAIDADLRTGKREELRAQQTRVPTGTTEEIQRAMTAPTQ